MLRNDTLAQHSTAQHSTAQHSTEINCAFFPIAYKTIIRQIVG